MAKEGKAQEVGKEDIMGFWKENTGRKSLASQRQEAEGIVGENGREDG